MNPDSLYIIDSDVLISAKNSYYSFEICPGFWDSLIKHHQSGEVFSFVDLGLLRQSGSGPAIEYQVIQS